MTGTQGQLGKVSRTLTSASRDGRPVEGNASGQVLACDPPNSYSITLINSAGAAGEEPGQAAAAAHRCIAAYPGEPSR